MDRDTRNQQSSGKNDPLITWFLTAIQQFYPGIQNSSKLSAIWQFLLRQCQDILAQQTLHDMSGITQKISETGGMHLFNSFKQFLDDVAAGRGRPHIPLVDTSAFNPGRDIACTPGNVIFRNDLIELIQYHPVTPKVYSHPLLIIPPWINKYYILDLRPENSMVRWLVGQGLTVFMISWVNADSALKDRTFDDYLLEGPITAMQIIKKTLGVSAINVTGYCIGGVLTACLLAKLAAMTEKKSRKSHNKAGTKNKYQHGTHHPELPEICSATFFTTLLDYSSPGETGLFIDEAQLEILEKTMKQKGYMDGSVLAALFAILRAKDLLWPAWVRHYLKGEKPPVSDFLYWNADATHIPAKVHSFYLRNMYIENRLVAAEKLHIAGTLINPEKIKTPAFFVAGERDHIAPWQSCFASAQLFNGPVKFVLSSSGHVAGIVNPPVMKRYSYRMTAKKLPDADTFLAATAMKNGSWWPAWFNFLKKYSGGLQTSTPLPASALGAAPGRYVKVTLADIAKKELSEE